MSAAEGQERAMRKLVLISHENKSTEKYGSDLLFKKKIENKLEDEKYQSFGTGTAD